MTGTSLRLAASLLESPITRPLLVPSAYKRLNMPLLLQSKVPAEVGLYINRHMSPQPEEDPS